MKKNKSFLFFLFLMLIQINVFSNNNVIYRNLVLEGGGVKGLAFCGALIELEKNGILDSIIRIGGVSVGGISAMLLSIGYSPEEIKNIIYDLKIQKFNDGGYLYIGGFIRLINRFGFYRGKKIEKYISKLIQDKIGNADITFRELHEGIISKKYIDLFIVATNLEKQKPEVFSYETFPGMKIRDALRASFSIPFYFKPVYLDSSGIRIEKRRNIDEADLYVDGGLSANFPIYIFDDKKYLIDKVNFVNAECDKFINLETLGIMLEAEKQYSNKENLGMISEKIESIEDFVIAFYSITIGTLYKYIISEADLKRVIIINTEDISPRIRKIKNKDKDMLIDNGRQAVKDFYKN